MDDPLCDPMYSGSLYLRHSQAGLRFHQMIQVNTRVCLDDQARFHIDFSLFYVCSSVHLQIRVLLVKDLKEQTTRPLLENCWSNQIRFEKQDLEKIASTNSIFSLRTVTTSLQYVGFLVTQHIDVRPNFLRKNIA